MKQIAHGEGKYQVVLEGYHQGDDLVFHLYGGTKPHIGAIALSSFYQNQMEVSHSYSLPHHKEQSLAEEAIRSLQPLVDGSVLISVGIHIDDATAEEISLLVHNARMCIKEWAQWYRKASVHGVILAGGRSSRMGMDKTILPIAGTPLIQKTLNTLRQVSDKVTVSVNDMSRSNYARLFGEVVWKADESHVAGMGPMAGMFTAMKGSLSSYHIVVACDMPFLQGTFLEWMVEIAKAEGADAVVPIGHDGKIHPLHGVYHRRCLPVIQQLLEAKKPRMLGLLEAANVKYLNPDTIEKKGFSAESFMNMNSPEDYKRIIQIMEDREGKEKNDTTPKRD
ncbi:molybdenum cofactor guanylyltransferase [Microaerobacter geothermalis]|uniref:molybdenum cofactor guanylyltransferase n=1 Tax=Microaerobacter geothermalis TaxID=674972 RepID=UPI001F4312B4|nr:molybdenum cofactor guanylyltransferase [Microaerobacter geothermalis]MCF6092641.1 molybdenum cofactor guanylyltransferase [Microaerobacter geothermalis]